MTYVFGRKRRRLKGRGWGGFLYGVSIHRNLNV